MLRGLASSVPGSNASDADVFAKTTGAGGWLAFAGEVLLGRGRSSVELSLLDTSPAAGRTGIAAVLVTTGAGTVVASSGFSATSAFGSIGVGVARMITLDSTSIGSASGSATARGAPGGGSSAAGFDESAGSCGGADAGPTIGMRSVFSPSETCPTAPAIGLYGFAFEAAAPRGMPIRGTTVAASPGFVGSGNGLVGEGGADGAGDQSSATGAGVVGRSPRGIAGGTSRAAAVRGGVPVGKMTGAGAIEPLFSVDASPSTGSEAGTSRLSKYSFDSVESVERSSNGDSSTMSARDLRPSSRRRMPLSSSGISLNRSSSRS